MKSQTIAELIQKNVTLESMLTKNYPKENDTYMTISDQSTHANMVPNQNDSNKNINSTLIDADKGETIITKEDIKIERGFFRKALIGFAK